MQTIPLFPLNTLLFPAVPLSLQIFEPRYLDMISGCMKRGEGFGVVPIREGREVGEIPQFFPVGVYVQIEDWHPQDNGLLGVVVRGERKFKVMQTFSQPDMGLSAEVVFLPQEPVLEIGLHHDGLVALVEQLREHPAVKGLNLPELVDARHLGWQLTQLLPISRPDKVALLEMSDPLLRLDHLAERIERLAAGEE